MLDQIIYSIKINFKNRDTIIWTILFPLIYMSVFVMALKDVENPENYRIDDIKMALVREGEYEDLEDFLEEVGAKEASLEGQELIYENLDQNLPLTYLETDSQRSLELLDENKVDFLVHLKGNEAQIEAINPNEAEVKIGKSLLESYEIKNALKESISKRYSEDEKLREDLMERAQKDPRIIEKIKANDLDGAKEILIEDMKEEQKDFKPFEVDSNRRRSASSDKNYFFSAIAYIAFFFMSTGNAVLEPIKADQSKLGLRNEISPLGKYRRFFLCILPSLVFISLFIMMIYSYTLFLGVDFGGDHKRMIFLLVLGSWSGFFTGTAISSLFSGKKQLRDVLSVALPLTFGFLSGMMTSWIVTLIKKQAPFLNNINPIAIMCRSMYALNSLSPISLYYDGIIWLVVYDLAMLWITLLALRRESYDSL